MELRCHHKFINTDGHTADISFPLYTRSKK